MPRGTTLKFCKNCPMDMFRLGIIPKNITLFKKTIILFCVSIKLVKSKKPNIEQ